MKSIEIKAGTGLSQILIGESIDNLKKYLPDQRVVIITDKNLIHHHGSKFPDAEVIEIGLGEEHKTLSTVSEVYQKLIDLEVDRSTFLLGIGGGIVCDVTGFIASTYMRGLSFGFVATSLLAQVDASVGGKNGVNYTGYKNIVGVFNQPQFVICDLDLLSTLPTVEIRCGFAEIIKHAAIADFEMFAYLEKKVDDALCLERAIIEYLVYNSIFIKSEIVKNDEREKGERRKLNFGHTFGHAIEKISHPNHGEAISLGMVLAAKLSNIESNLNASDVSRVISMLKRYNLPYEFTGDPQLVVQAIRQDKKRELKNIHFVLLEKIGHCVVKKMSLERLAAFLLN